MAPRWKSLLGGVGMVAATIGILPVASGIGAAPQSAPLHQVNRAGKADRLAAPASVAAKRKNPVRTIREAPSDPETAKRKLLEGCEPMFSPVAVPQAAHLAGRCIG
jgi:hypothetical protein